MSATNRAMVKQLDISLAWWRVKELHTNSFVEVVEFQSKRYCPVTNSRGNFQPSWKSGPRRLMLIQFLHALADIAKKNHSCMIIKRQCIEWNMELR
jgi:hypothetical protein